MYVADERIAFNLQGLRYVQKSDRSYSGEETFRLELQYKGSSTTVSYKDKAVRDSIYELAVEKLKAARSA